MNQFVIVNGNVVDKDDVNLSHLFWENQKKISREMWFGFGGIPLFTENIDLLIRELEILNLPCPDLLKNKRELFRITKRMLNKNKFYRSGFIHFQLFWNEKEFNTIITSQAFKTFNFPISEKGILVNFSDLEKYSKNQMNRFSFYSESFWNLVSAKNRETSFQNSIILNENQSVCECISSNIFLIKENELFTPSLNTGCFKGNLRNTILEISTQLNLKTTESSTLKKEDIFTMEELFIASEENGMQWILGVENKRFVHHYSEKINESLNDYLKEKVN